MKYYSSVVALLLALAVIMDLSSGLSPSKDFRTPSDSIADRSGDSSDPPLMSYTTLYYNFSWTCAPDSQQVIKLDLMSLADGQQQAVVLTTSALNPGEPRANHRMAHTASARLFTERIAP
ncbi:uncharacterized protein [Dermacentor albipictus]|uniref:uncharacterized protein isoform X2 n=1 Tax=Dermacentor albipictus TaxID=60249 RepID=UPI0031FE2621